LGISSPALRACIADGGRWETVGRTPNQLALHVRTQAIGFAPLRIRWPDSFERRKRAVKIPIRNQASRAGQRDLAAGRHAETHLAHGRRRRRRGASIGR
jgi:hypothetical protein